MCFTLALGDHPQGSNWGYTLAIIRFALVTIFVTVSALLLAFKGLNRLVKGSGDFFSDAIFQSIVLSLAERLGLYVVASVILVSCFSLLSLDFSFVFSLTSQPHSLILGI